MKHFKRNRLFFILSVAGAALDIFSKYLLFALVWKAIVFVPSYRLTLEANHRKTLDNYRISPEMRDAFTTKNQALSTGASVKIFNPEEYWIYDGEKRYRVEARKEGLAVYTHERPIPRDYYQIGPFLFVPEEYRMIPVIPHLFNLRIALNLGAVWSSFHGQRIFLTLFSMLAILFIFYLVFKNDYSASYQTSLGLIMAGALGNLWDRIWYGGVRDFLDFYITPYHWPTFNFADAWIVLGIALFLFLEWKHEKKSGGKKSKS